MGYSPRGCKELDTTERLHFHTDDTTLMEHSEEKLLSRVRLFATPWTVAHQAPPSMGFSRQEYWSGLPFPSPMCENEVAQSCPTLCDPMDCSLPGSSIHGIFQARVLEWGAITFSVFFILLLLLSHFSRVRLCETP